MIFGDNFTILNKNANIAKIFSGTNMHIPRTMYLEKLKAKINNGLAKTITGIRCCDKSYLLYNYGIINIGLFDSLLNEDCFSFD